MMFSSCGALDNRYVYNISSTVLAYVLRLNLASYFTRLLIIINIYKFIVNIVVARQISFHYY